MTIETSTTVAVQFAVPVENTSHDDVVEWVDLARGTQSGELCVRFMDLDEARVLNRRFRKIDNPTNVLAFPSDHQDTLGDLAICVPVALQEAQQQGKSFSSHLAHLVIHGTLHLCGLDHQTEHGSRTMESLESDLMHRLGYPDPYKEYG